MKPFDQTSNTENEISKKNINSIMICLLPIISLIIIFGFTLVQRGIFISEWHDTLANAMPYLFLADNPMALWNNAWISGFPEITSPMSDRFYPFSLPLFIIFKDIFILNWVIIAHLFVSFCTSYLLFSLMRKEAEIPSYVIPIFALLYMLSGVMLARVYAGHIFIIYALAWIPLLYYSYFKLVRYSNRTIINILLFSASSLLILFSASIYYLFFAYFFILLLFLYDCHRSLDIRSLSALLLGFVVFLLVGAIKILPGLEVSGQVIRQDVIDPLSNGGSIESALGSFIFGTPINKGYDISGMVFGFHESIVLIGIIPLFFILLGFIYGKKTWSVPIFLAFCISLIWAAGGKTLFYFVHLLPILDTFRCPGRIFAPLLPLLLIIGIFGLTYLLSRIDRNEPLPFGDEEKKRLIYGIGIIALLKLTELPYQEAVTIESAIAVGMVAILLGIIATKKSQPMVVLGILGLFFIINFYVINLAYKLTDMSVIARSLLIGFILLLSIYYFSQGTQFRKNTTILVIILVIGITLSIAGNISYLTPSDPNFDESPAIAIIDQILQDESNNPQIWVMTTGWPIMNIDMTYLFIQSGIHPVRAYYAYYLKTTLSPFYTIGEITYSTADYIIDDGIRQGGEANIDDPTFVAGGVPVLRSDNVLPNVFILRNEEVIPVNYERFTPDEVIVSGEFLPDDIVVLKTAYYEGWEINGEKAQPIGNMVALQLTDVTPTVRFSFGSPHYTLAFSLTIVGLLCAIAIFTKRRTIDAYLTGQPDKEIKSKKVKRKK